MRNRIRELREERNWTAQDLADHLDCSMQQVYRLEGEQRELTKGWLEKLSRVFGRPMGYIMGEELLPEDTKPQKIDGEIYSRCLEVIKTYFDDKKINPGFWDAAPALVTIYDFAADEKERTGKVSDAKLLLKLIEELDKHKVRSIKNVGRKKIKKA